MVQLSLLLRSLHGHTGRSAAAIAARNRSLSTTRGNNSVSKFLPSLSSMSNTLLHQQEHSFRNSSSTQSSTSYLNTTLRRLSVATVGIVFQRVRSDILEDNTKESQIQHRNLTASVLQQQDDDDDHEDGTTDIMDYFAIFGMPRQYDIDMKQLKQQYLKLMNEYHPDKQNQQQPQQQLNDESTNNDTTTLTANDITNAYQLLSEPHSRANHLLELIGHPILEDHCQRDNMGSSSSALVGMDFLLQMMEWRERIETLAMCSKHTDDGIPCSCGSDDKDQELQNLFDETQSLQHNCEEELADVWRRNTNDINLNVNDLQSAQKLTAQLQYWHRLETALREEMEL